MTSEARLQPPQTIRLPDGREFNTQDLLRQRTRAQNHSLLKPRQLKTKVPKTFQGAPSRKRIKYTIEDRIWLAQATAAQIQARYSIGEKAAVMMKYQSRYIIEQLDLIANADK